MPDDNIKAVLKRAAADPSFMQALVDNREAALRDVPLEPHEKQMLLAVPEEQLRKMIAASGKSPPRVSRIIELGCATALVAAALAVAIPTQLRGISPDVREESTASKAMRAIATAEARYKTEYGRYGSLEDLRKHQLEWPDHPSIEKYVFEITASADTFAATARHKERPQTRKAFVIGPDGVLKELPRE
ncbi:MAG TPA: hypothetical protein VGP72_15980 [Planctomycetota bacterium]|jgi:predicted O-methyltransferase YrrM